MSKNKGLIISFSVSLKFNPNIGFELFNSGSNLFKSSSSSSIAFAFPPFKAFFCLSILVLIVSISARINSVNIISKSLKGLTSPICVIFPSSKTLTTCKIALTSLI